MPRPQAAGVIELWRVTHTKTGDTLLVRFFEVLHDSAHELGIDPGLQKDGVEADLQRLLAEQVEVIGDGLTLVRREFPTAIGPVDLLLRDAAGGTIAVEVKRRGDIDGVEQLTRYLELLGRDPHLTPVTGRVRRAGDQAPGARARRGPRHPLRDTRLRRHEGARVRRSPALLTAASLRSRPIGCRHAESLTVDLHPLGCRRNGGGCLRRHPATPEDHARALRTHRAHARRARALDRAADVPVLPGDRGHDARRRLRRGVVLSHPGQGRRVHDRGQALPRRRRARSPTSPPRAFRRRRRAASPRSRSTRSWITSRLAPHLTAIVGATQDERTLSDKADIVAEALRRLDAAGVDTSRPVLIGDRHHDVEGAAVHGVPVIFVRWGFSWPHEADGAQAAVDTMDQLRALLLIEDADD